jgi:hypothetical protein
MKHCIKYLIHTEKAAAFIYMPRGASSDFYGEVQEHFANTQGKGTHETFATLTTLNPEDVTPQGVLFEWGLASAAGAYFNLFAFPNTTKEAIKESKDWLRRERDVVRCSVIRIPEMVEDYAMPRWKPTREQFESLKDGKSGYNAVAYRPGDTNLIDVGAWIEGKGVCTAINETPIDEWEEGVQVMHIDDAVDLIQESSRKKYCKEWIETTEENYDDMLNCLPPERREGHRGVRFFSMCEYLTSDITQFLACLDGRYFCAHRPARYPAAKIAEEVANAARSLQSALSAP